MFTTARSSSCARTCVRQWARTSGASLAHCSDGLEFTRWNGDVVGGAFIIDAHDRETIAWRAVVNAGVSGSDIRDIMLEAVERRFGTYSAPSVVEMLSDNGSPYIARDTQIFARQLGLKPCFTPRSGTFGGAQHACQRHSRRRSSATASTSRRCQMPKPFWD